MEFNDNVSDNISTLNAVGAALSRPKYKCWVVKRYYELQGYVPGKCRGKVKYIWMEGSCRCLLWGDKILDSFGK